MRVETRDGGPDARLVLSRMCVDAHVLGVVAARWDGKLFGSKAENLIAGWAVGHYRNYTKAPGKLIGLYYERWAETARDDATADLVGHLLEAVSDEQTKNGDGVAPKVALDVAADVFDRVRLDRLQENVSACVQAGDLKRALAEVGGFCRVPVASTSGYNVYEGGAVAKNSLSRVSETLIEWDQEAMRKFFDFYLSREEFVVFLGPEKRGKSFWLQEVAYQGIRCGRNVAFFEVGDQSLDQIYRRFIARAADRPVRADRCVKRPTELTPSGDGEAPTVVHKEESYEAEIDQAEGSQALRAVGRRFGADKLRLSVHPNSSVTIEDIDTILSDWERDGFRADVVVLDYLDILRPLDGKAETRDQINATWKAARRICQSRHVLFVAATQANAESYSAHRLTMANFSEDHRKNAHPTGIVGINQTAREKEKGMYRLNWIFARDLEFGPTTEVYTAGCLAVANPCVLSCF